MLEWQFFSLNTQTHSRPSIDFILVHMHASNIICQRYVSNLVILSFPPQSPLPPSLGKGVRSIKLPDMPMGGDLSNGAAIHNSKVYISAMCEDETGKLVHRIFVYSTNEQKWNVLENPKQNFGSAIALVNNHITLIGGGDEIGKVTDTLSTWYEEEGRWKQVLPPMPTRQISPAVISHDNLLLVTGGATEYASIRNTTNVLDLATMKWTTPEELNLPVPLWRHHLALCGEYLYLVGGAMLFYAKPPEDVNSQAWRAKWSEVKQIAAPQHSQPRRGVWMQIADPPTLCPTPVSCGGTLYTVGGRTRCNNLISTVYSYITARDQWVSVGDMSVGRVDSCAVPLSSTSIFVAGGSFLDDEDASDSPLTELLQL